MDEPMSKWEVELYTPLSADECMARLRAAVGRSLLGGEPVVGTVSGRSVSLRRRTLNLNSFQVALVGSVFDRKEGGAVFQGQSEHPPFAVAAMGCMTLAALVAVPAMLYGIVSGKAPLLYAIPWLIGVMALPWVVSRTAREDKVVLADFVAATIAAGRVEETSQPS